MKTKLLIIIGIVVISVILLTINTNSQVKSKELMADDSPFTYSITDATANIIDVEFDSDKNLKFTIISERSGTITIEAHKSELENNESTFEPVVFVNRYGVDLEKIYVNDIVKLRFDYEPSMSKVDIIYNWYP